VHLGIDVYWGAWPGVDGREGGVLWGVDQVDKRGRNGPATPDYRPNVLEGGPCVNCAYRLLRRHILMRSPLP
jgi:hypothetical protein